MSAENETMALGSNSQEMNAMAFTSTSPLAVNQTRRVKPHYPSAPTSGKPSDGISVVSQSQAQTQQGNPSCKRGFTNVRDSINALLSLGHELDGEAQNDGSSVSTAMIAPKPPTSSSAKRLDSTVETVKTCQNKASTDSRITTNAQQGYKFPPDFWYWLPPGDSVGEWDVLCGRGGGSNNSIGNRNYRKIVNDRKPAYREIPLKQRKAKTGFVKNIVQHVNNCGGRFVDFDSATGQYYVVTMEKARKKTSQALRETKELKWLNSSTKREDKKAPTSKDATCPYCQQKTIFSKTCLKHNEWLQTKFPSVPVGTWTTDGTAVAANPLHESNIQSAPGLSSSSVEPSTFGECSAQVENASTSLTNLEGVSQGSETSPVHLLPVDSATAEKPILGPQTIQQGEHDTCTGNSRTNEQLTFQEDLMGAVGGNDASAGTIMQTDAV